MPLPVFIQFEYQSRYSLLGAMAKELAEAMSAKGFDVNPGGLPVSQAGAAPALVVWFNFLSDVNHLRPEMTRPGSLVTLAQFFVDHPLAIWAQQMDALSRMDNFRMLLPCLDGTHLLRLRWPRLKHVHCLHGVSPAALAARETIGAARENDLLVMGSIHTEAELGAMRAQIPGRLQRACDDAVELMTRHAWLTYEQAVEVTLAPLGALIGDWQLLSGVWRYVTAAVNRARRVSLVRAMEGVRTVVHGAEAWKEFCRGGAGAAERSTIEYRGDLPYAETSAALRGARACLAWGPTQFTHSFSERLLLSLAAGCATVADDRLMVRKHFGGEGEGETKGNRHQGLGIRRTGEIAEKREKCVALFDAGDPASAREAVEGTLKDPEECVAMGRAGRDAVEAGHLWAHRVATVAGVSGQAAAA